MSDNRKYYYLKLKENFYNSETMVILESMQDGLLYSNLLLKMYLMSLKSGGILMLNDHLPHTPQTIATEGLLCTLDEALGVSPSALDIPRIKSHEVLNQLLFALEDEYGLTITITEINKRSICNGK